MAILFVISIYQHELAQKITCNLAAVDDLSRLFPELDLIIIESGGDNLSATFSPELADLAPMVGASLAVMEADTKKMRGNKPFVFANMKTGQGLKEILAFIGEEGMLNTDPKG